MLLTTLNARAKLEREGLYVRCNNSHSLWIAATVHDMGEGLNLSDDACSLIENSDQWIAVFPAEGLLTYEVPGSLSDLVTLIMATYTHYRRAGGPFKDALKHVVTDPERYLVGRSPAHV